MVYVCTRALACVVVVTSDTRCVDGICVAELVLFCCFSCHTLTTGVCMSDALVLYGVCACRMFYVCVIFCFCGIYIRTLCVSVACVGLHVVVLRLRYVLTIHMVCTWFVLFSLRLCMLLCVNVMHTVLYVCGVCLFVTREFLLYTGLVHGACVCVFFVLFFFLFVAHTQRMQVTCVALRGLYFYIHGKQVSTYGVWCMCARGPWHALLLTHDTRCVNGMCVAVFVFVLLFFMCHTLTTECAWMLLLFCIWCVHDV